MISEPSRGRSDAMSEHPEVQRARQLRKVQTENLQAKIARLRIPQSEALSVNDMDSYNGKTELIRDLELQLLAGR